ncbi:hypothetical protein J8273_6574 [Carpediemonas membranifera]|uniref:Capsular polysaccharide biosynthesis protein n=1 Tax=Carpediemonas membranifera TaxID=201153 RepID=A0A8J6E8E6_9EUKA|nr:hypothetical protein J8273_6574 [Carpediemonas membranifera]|eukprot:KAG9391795.1 hypothetical protein J8273_6574 [Carpediemonas membranifera]
MRALLILTLAFCYVLAGGVYLYDPSNILTVSGSLVKGDQMSATQFYSFAATAAALPISNTSEAIVSRTSYPTYSSVLHIEIPDTTVIFDNQPGLKTIFASSTQISNVSAAHPPSYYHINGEHNRYATDSTLTQCSAPFCTITLSRSHDDISEKLTAYLARRPDTVLLLTVASDPVVSFQTSLYRLALAFTTILLAVLMFGAVCYMWTADMDEDPLVYSGPGPAPAVDMTLVDGGDYCN